MVRAILEEAPTAKVKTVLTEPIEAPDIIKLGIPSSTLRPKCT